MNKKNTYDLILQTTVQELKEKKKKKKSLNVLNNRCEYE